MTGPLDAVTAFHDAFRRDMGRIDAAAFDMARGHAGQESEFERHRFFGEMLAWHAHGEELGVFPVLERVAPLVAEPYITDHRGLDAAANALKEAAAAGDRLATARATAAYKFHLDIHLRKEDAHVYRLMRERLDLPEQAEALSTIAGAVPQERFADVIAWIYPLLGIKDRENLTRVYQTMVPPAAFKSILQLIRRAIGEDWAELARRIPGLA